MALPNGTGLLELLVAVVVVSVALDVVLVCLEEPDVGVARGVAGCPDCVPTVCQRALILSAASVGIAVATVAPISPLQCRLSPGAKALLVVS